MTLRRRISALILSCATAAALVGSAGIAGSGTVSAAPSAKQAAAARAFAERIFIGGTHSGKPVRLAHGTVHTDLSGLTQYDSYNWAGYADDNSSGTTYTKAAGTWTEPTITCSSTENQLAAFWVGIDGWTSSSVEQAGTLAECYLGTAYYYTWWEMYPTNSVQIVANASAGDSITTTITYTASKYKLQVTDATHSSGSFTTTQACGSGVTCSRTSAEWIAEAPSGTRGEYPLPKFTNWRVTAASVTGSGTAGKISSFSDDETTMINGDDSYNLATPGALNAAGNAFTVTWGNSY